MKNRDSTLLAWLAVKLLRTIIKTAKWVNAETWVDDARRADHRQGEASGCTIGT